MEPVFIVATTDDQVPRVAPFRDLYALKPTVVHMTLLWDHNSYHVHVKERYFIINGGRKIAVHDPIDDPVTVLYARRNRRCVGVNSGDVGSIPEVSYLLGIENTSKQLFLHITGDGKFWTWKNHR